MACRGVSCAPEGRAGERRTAERAAGYQGRATGVLGRGAAPGLEVGVDKNPGGVGGPSSAQQTPPATPTLSFQPSTPGTCGQAADHVVRQVTARVDLAVAACGCLTQLSGQVPVASGPAACENRLHLPSPHRLGPSGGCDEQWVVGISIHKSVTSLRQKGENCS